MLSSSLLSFITSLISAWDGSLSASVSDLQVDFLASLPRHSATKKITKQLTKSTCQRKRLKIIARLEVICFIIVFFWLSCQVVWIRQETDRRIESLNSNDQFRYNLYDTVNKCGQMRMNNYEQLEG